MTEQSRKVYPHDEVCTTSAGQSPLLLPPLASPSVYFEEMTTIDLVPEDPTVNERLTFAEKKGSHPPRRKFTIHLTESTFSSKEEQLKIATCVHRFFEFGEDYDVFLFGYLKVSAMCIYCTTYRR